MKHETNSGKCFSESGGLHHHAAVNFVNGRSTFEDLSIIYDRIFVSVPVSKQYKN